MDTRILSLEGHEKCFKTTTAYTAPLPIVGFQFDQGHGRALYGTKFKDYFDGLDIEIITYKPGMKYEVNSKPWVDKDITIFILPPPIQLDPRNLKGFEDMWNYFIMYYIEALQDVTVSSVVIDTATLARSTRADAFLEIKQKTREANDPIRTNLLQIEYKDPNDAIRTIIASAQALQKNLILVHHLKEKYEPTMKDGVRTMQFMGNYELEGYSKTNQAVDWAVRNTKDSQGNVQSLITVCGDDISLEGTVLPPVTWDMLASMVEGRLENRVKFGKRFSE